MRPERIWYGRDLGARIVRALLLPLTGLYWLGWRGYELVYKLGLKKPKEPHKPVVCIGNLTVGGSGKTPTTIHVAKTLIQNGEYVVIGASGYGSPASEGAAVAPEGELSAREWGDEPALIRWLLPEIPLIVGRSRTRAAELCRERFPEAVFLMDDGLQHLPLKKHVKIALDSKGKANRFVLPAGPYRQPFGDLNKMDLVLLRSQIEFGNRGFLLNGAESASAPKTAVALTAIAKPNRFIDDLRSERVEVKMTRLLPDHDPLTAGNLFEGLPPDLPIVVTAKDWVKLRERDNIADLTVYVAMHEAAIEPAENFLNWLRQKLDEIKEAQRT